MNNWHGILKILEVQHVRNNKVIWEAKNLLNTLHSGGELYILSCAFNNDGSLPVSNYYLGLDDRRNISFDHDINDLVDEPSGNGYFRVAVNSSNWTVELINGVYRATSEIVTFTATGSGYGEVSNLFLTTESDNSGILLATSPLSSTISLASGDAINLRFALSLRDKNKT